MSESRNLIEEYYSLPPDEREERRAEFITKLRSLGVENAEEIIELPDP